MPYKRLIQLYSDRKSKLQSLLDDNDIELTERRQYRLRGAVEEISLFLSVLEQEQNTRKLDNLVSDLSALKGPRL